MQSYAIDEGGPLGAGLQEQASNYHKLLWSRVKVVSVMEKAQLCVMYEIGRRMKMNH
ncbi:hypothetical protein [Wolbachia endosymbiont of Atemnus politus]|uniref:hypothetical protein n=1 Tax=Wolbachia endosymbiont of Atemnus politus TaxID=2682840 RepID=UPI001573F872|nr:hypothetical protein [Wolbachia endosymbiont of Atemnus politus]